MRFFRLFAVSFLSMVFLTMSGICVTAQQMIGENFSLSRIDSAMMAIIEGDMLRAERWTNNISSLSADSDFVCITNCLLSCLDVSDGKSPDSRVFSESIRRFAGRRDLVALCGLATAYAANGFFELEFAMATSDKNLSTAERYAKGLNDKYLELSFALLRSKLYIRSRRYVEAAYCIRNIMSEAKNRYPDVLILAQINLLRTYSAIRVWSMVNEISHNIEQAGVYALNPVYACEYYRSMAINAIRLGSRSEANVYSWRACQNAAKYKISNSSAWRVSIVRALGLLTDRKYEDAKQIVDSCETYIGVIPSNTIEPYFSRHNLRLVEAQIEMACGNFKIAKALLDSWQFPPEIFEFDDFARRYYNLREKLAVNDGDYQSALNIIQKTDSICRSSLLLRSRIRSKDMEVALREDSTLDQQRQELFSSQNDISSQRRSLAYVGISLLTIILLCVASYLVKIRLENKKRQELDVEYNKKLSTEIKRQIDEFEEQNKLLIKRNTDMAASQSYARRMQRGILPNVNRLVKMGLKDSFIIRSSSDSVSGCFYWYRKSCGKIYVCCADSDWGGGLAGAMMSMVGLTLINDAVSSNQGYNKASQLIEIVNSGFSSHLPDSRLRRGLAMSIAVVDTKLKTVCVSCAASCAAVHSNGRLITVPSAKSKIGEGFLLGPTLSDVEFPYESGDSVFLYSSSMTKISNAQGEQIGEENISKVLMTAAKLPAKLHHDAILNELLHWASPLPFVDDVLLVGFSLP